MGRGKKSIYNVGSETTSTDDMRSLEASLGFHSYCPFYCPCSGGNVFFVDGGSGYPPENRYLPTPGLQEQERISGTWDAQLFRN